MNKDITKRLKRSTLFKDSFWGVFGSAVGYGLSLISGILIAREMGKEVYGEFGMIKQTLGYIAVISTFGLGSTCTRYMARYKSRTMVKKYITSATLIISASFSILLAILLFIFARKLSIILDNILLEVPFKITSIVLIFNSVYTSFQGLLSGEKRFKAVAMIKIAYGFLMLITTVLFFRIWKLNGAIIGLLVTFVLSSLLCMKYVRISTSTRRLNIKKLFDYSAHLIKFSLPIAIQEGFNVALQWAFIFIIVRLSDYGQLGIYTAAGQWLSVLTFIPMSLRFVALSHLSSVSNVSTHKRTLKYLIIITLITTLLPLLIILPLSGFISSFYGSTFLTMPPVLCVLCSSAVFEALTMTLSQESIAKGNTWIVCNSKLIGQLIGIGIVVVLIITKTFPAALSAAVALLLSSILTLIILSIAYRFNKLRSLI